MTSKIAVVVKSRQKSSKSNVNFGNEVLKYC